MFDDAEKLFTELLRAEERTLEVFQVDIQIYTAQDPDLVIKRNVIELGFVHEDG